MMLSCPFSGISERVCSKSYSFDNRRRGGEYFVIIQRTESGCGIFQNGDRRLKVPPGSAFVAVVPERSRYFFDSGEPWIFTWINFYGRLASEFAKALRETHGPVVPMASHGEAFGMFHSLAKSVSSKSRDPWRHSINCFEFLSTWFDELSRPLGAPSDPTDVAAEIMEQRFREPLAVKEIASQVGLTREHFSRLFTERYGIGPAAHLRQIRTRQAARLLAEQNLSLREIALRSGFPSIAALRRANIAAHSASG